MQRRFVSDVSHELRTPLTTVRMAADVLHEAREDFDPAVARCAELLQTQLDRFEALLADLLEISRYDAGAAALDVEPTDVRGRRRAVIEATEPLAERRGSRVDAARAGGPVRRRGRQPARRADPAQPGRQRHRARRGPADRRARRAPTTTPSRSPCATTASGLRPGEAAMVFNRFWRADPARARTTGGTGLGLSIALEDARLHGGWLQAWGEPGDGSAFRLTLPRGSAVELEGSPLPLEPVDFTRPQPVAAGQPYRRTVPRRRRCLSAGVGSRLAVAARAAGRVLLAGCARPDLRPGPRRPRPAVQRRDDVVRVIGQPPSPGARPQDIVRGFLQAGADFIDDHAVARLHLAPAAGSGGGPGRHRRLDRSEVALAGGRRDEVERRGGRIDGQGPTGVAGAPR